MHFFSAKYSVFSIHDGAVNKILIVIVQYFHISYMQC